MGRRSHPVNLSHAVRAAGLSWIEPDPAVRLGRRGRKAAILRLKGNEHAALNCERGLRRNTDSVAEQERRLLVPTIWVDDHVEKCTEAMPLRVCIGKPHVDPRKRPRGQITRGRQRLGSLPALHGR